MTSKAELARVSRLYYEDDLTQSEIAALLGLQRVKVTRMLAEARRTGVVTITVHGAPEHPFEEEERALADRYHLTRCQVATTSRQPENTARAVAAAAAQSLAKIVDSSSMIVVGLSRGVVAAVRAMVPAAQTRHPGVIPLGGSWGRSCDGMSPHELATVLAQKAEGTSYSYPAPMLAGTVTAAATFNADPLVARALDLIRRADALVVGVGEAPGGPDSLLGNLLSDDDVADLRSRGAVGDVCGRYFDASGNRVDSEVDRRVVGIDMDEVRAIPHRLGIAYGPRKISPLAAALGGGVLNGLVTDVTTARALLN